MENNTPHPGSDKSVNQSPSHPWLEQEARPTPSDPIDQELLYLLEKREQGYDLLAGRPLNEEFVREKLGIINQYIAYRKQELGINPLTHPEIDPPPSSSQE